MFDDSERVPPALRVIIPIVVWGNGIAGLVTAFASLGSVSFWIAAVAVILGVMTGLIFAFLYICGFAWPFVLLVFGIEVQPWMWCLWLSGPLMMLMLLGYALATDKGRASDPR
jgi:hypothetical protein